MRTHYIGARYIPLVYEGPDGSPDWLPGVAYEGLTIVKYGNFSYISKKPVPAGAGDPETASSYWIRASLYNADVEEVRSLLDQKADKDGSYPDLWAGNILTDKYQSERTPYILRRTGGGLPKIGEREDDTLVGVSVAENQLITITSGTTTVNGITFTKSEDGTISASGTATGGFAFTQFINVPLIANHAYLLTGCPSEGGAGNYALYANNTNPQLFDTGSGSLKKQPSDTIGKFYVIVYEGVTVNITFRPQLINLTQKYGSSIADYLYNLETATAGAGIAKLREWGFLTEEYIPYNEGSLESVETTAHVMRDADENIIGNYDLGTDTLRGLFKLDSNNNLYADGDTKTSDGTVTRRYGVVDFGTLNWTYWQAQSLFYVEIPTKAQGTNNFITSKYPTLQSGGYGELTDKQIVGSQTNSYIYVKDSSYTDAATFTAAMSGVYLVYELATPTTEQSTPFTSPQICDPDGTEEYVTSNGVPVGHETKYYYSIKGLAEELIDIPEVPEQNGTYTLKATRNAAGITYNWEV